MLSMSSLVLVSHGPWLPSTGKLTENSLLFPSEGNKILLLYKIVTPYNYIFYYSSLGFSVTVFCIEAGLAILILLARRHPAVGGELGGPKFFKTCSSAAFVFFWCFYVAISAMEAYGVINPGF